MLSSVRCKGNERSAVGRVVSLFCIFIASFGFLALSSSVAAMGSGNFVLSNR